MQCKFSPIHTVHSALCSHARFATAAGHFHHPTLDWPTPPGVDCTMATFLEAAAVGDCIDRCHFELHSQLLLRSSSVVKVIGIDHLAIASFLALVRVLLLQWSFIPLLLPPSLPPSHLSPSLLPLLFPLSSIVVAVTRLVLTSGPNSSTTDWHRYLEHWHMLVPCALAERIVSYRTPVLLDALVQKAYITGSGHNLHR